MAECIQPGCDGYRKSKLLGYCDAHLKRYNRNADMTKPIKRYRKSVPYCVHPGCGRHVKAGDLCAGHYTQSCRGRELRSIRSIHDHVAYEAAHFRTAALWGSASTHRCVDCGVPAKDWAYDGTDPTQLLGGSARDGRAAIMFYSRYPEFYMPLCRRCHNRRDKAAQQRELSEYRSWRHRTGKTLA